MELQFCSGVEVEIGVVYLVQLLEFGYCVEYDVLEVNCQVQDQYGDDDGKLERYVDVVE